MTAPVTLSQKFRIRLQISYRGTDFYGWQKQPDQDATIQGYIERALSQIFNEKIRLIGSGRTDRGAHALSQWAHADLPKDPRDFSLQYALNCLLPESIRIESLWQCPEDFHAQRSSLKKKYIYKVYNSEMMHPFWSPYSHHIGQPLNIDLLNEISEHLVGTMDFKSFQSKGTEVESTIRTIHKAYWKQKGSVLTFQIVGNGFLKQMVRNIVASLIWAQDQDAPHESFKKIIRATDRSFAKGPAPSKGLFLKWVKYPQELDIKCRKL